MHIQSRLNFDSPPIANFYEKKSLLKRRRQLQEIRKIRLDAVVVVVCNLMFIGIGLVTIQPDQNGLVNITLASQPQCEE
jgi:hypothetical protein